MVNVILFNITKQLQPTINKKHKMAQAQLQAQPKLKHIWTSGPRVLGIKHTFTSVEKCKKVDPNIAKWIPLLGDGISQCPKFLAQVVRTKTYPNWVIFEWLERS